MSRPWRKPRITPDDVKFAEFSGLVNTRSRKDLGMKSLYLGTNVVISDTKKITRRPGYMPFYDGAVKSAYARAGGNLYVVADGSLLRMLSSTDVRTLTTGLTGVNYAWATVNDDAYFVNGIEAGIARDDLYLPWRITLPAITSVSVQAADPIPPTLLNVGQGYNDVAWRFCATYELADGRESAPSDLVEIRASPLARIFQVAVAPLYARTNIYVTEPNGTVFRLAATTTMPIVSVAPAQASRELTTYGTNSIPEGIDVIAYLNGRFYGSEYEPAFDTSFIWMSQPYGFHLWELVDFIPVAGRCSLLLWCNEGLLIGTSHRIYLYTQDNKLEQLADYGVVPGSPGDTDPQRVAYFWTARGMCKAMPFENLTEDDINMAPGVNAVGKLVYINGMKQFVVITRGGGTPFNQRVERS